MIDQKPDGYPGGIEYHLLDLVGGFIRRRLPVYVFFPEKDCLRLRLYKDYRVEETAYEGGGLVDHRLRDVDIEKVFVRMLDGIDVDIVHFHSIRTLPLSLIEKAKERNKKVLVTLHEYYFWCINCIMLAPEFCWFEKDEAKCFQCLLSTNYRVEKGYVGERRLYTDYLLRKVDGIIAPSQYVSDVLLGLYPGVCRDRCTVFEPGIDSGLLREEREGTVSVKNGALHLAFLGNFLHYKGNMAFLKLMKHFRNSGEVTFSIIGNIFDPSLVPSYKNLNVIGGYTRSDVVKTIHSADPDLVLLLSNWPETFSYTLSEAIASEVPVIATDGGALRQRVSKEAVGFLVPVENPVPRAIEIIDDVKAHPEVVPFLRGRVREAKKRLKTVEEMCDDHFRLYASLS